MKNLKDLSVKEKAQLATATGALALDLVAAISIVSGMRKQRKVADALIQQQKGGEEEAL